MVVMRMKWSASVKHQHIGAQLMSVGVLSPYQYTYSVGTARMWKECWGVVTCPLSFYGYR